MKKTYTKLLAVFMAICMVVTLFPLSAFAEGSDYVRKVVYADSGMENFAFEAADDINVPIGVFVYGTAAGASYELTEEDVSGFFSLAGVDATLSSGVEPRSDFQFDLFGGATLVYGEMKATAKENFFHDVNREFDQVTADEIAEAYDYIDVSNFVLSPAGTSCTMGGNYMDVKIGSGQTWTVPANDELFVGYVLDVDGELIGTDETSRLLLHTYPWFDGTSTTTSTVSFTGSGLTLYADVGDPELFEITSENLADCVSQIGSDPESLFIAFKWQDNKWIYVDEDGHGEPPAPGENQFRIWWDDYVPEGGSEAVAKYKIGSGNEEAAEMNALIDIEAGASLTYIYTPAEDGSGNPEPFWGFEVCFEGSEPEFIAKEDLTEENGTYSFTVDRSENNAGLTLGALRNDPHGSPMLGDKELDSDFTGGSEEGEYENILTNEHTWTVPAGEENKLIVRNSIIVGEGGGLVGTDDSSRLDIQTVTNVKGVQLYAADGTTEMNDITTGELSGFEGFGQWVSFRWQSDRWVLSDIGGGHEEPPAPGENQFRIWWDDFVPEGGSEAVAKFKIGSGSEQAAQMNAVIGIEAGASLTFIYTPAEDGSGNPEPFWGIEVCFEGSAPEFIAKEDITEESGTYSYTVDRSENNAGLNVGALRNDPQGGTVPGDMELDADFTGGGHYESINTNEFTWTVPAGDENKLIVRNSIIVGEGGGLVGTDETSVLEIQTITNVKGVQLYSADGTTKMNDITTGELSGVDDFGQWVSFGWQSGKWVLLSIPPCEHSFTNYTSNNDATCQANCTETATCENGCGATDTREIPNSKNFDNHVLTTFTYTSNGNGTHTKKHECCGTEAETEDCSGGRATCTNKAVCSECKAEYGKLAAHEHDSEWKSDENGHWRECVCGDKGTVTAHTPDRPAPTATEPVKCEVCDYIIAPAAGVTQPEVIRFGGDTRIETALLISGNWESAENVVLANGRSYADALAGVPLAYALGAPILLIEGESIDSSIMERIAELGAQNVYLLGGEVAISSAAEKQLTDGKYNVERIAGASRFGTAVEIANKLKSISGSAPESVFFANGYNYPDALAVSSAAALQGKPVLYAQQSEPLDDITRAYLTENGIENAVVLGGEVAVSAEVYSDIGSVCTNLERINGSDRYETAAEIIGKFGSTFAGKGIAVATGMNYPDALAGAAFAAKQGLAVMLVPDTLEDDEARTEKLKQLISAETETVYVFGGQGAVSDAVIDTLLG